MDNETLKFLVIRGFGFLTKSFEVPYRYVKLGEGGEALWWRRLVVESPQQYGVYRLMKDATIPDPYLLNSILNHSYRRNLHFSNFKHLLKKREAS